MSMGLRSKLLWNNKNFGNISNGERANNLVQCNNTYTVYNPTLREPSNSIHNYFHQMEFIFSFANQSLFDEFTGISLNFRNSDLYPNCGKCHFPPNTRKEYVYNDSNTVSNSCKYWGTNTPNQIEQISCKTWNCDHNQYYIWWMKNIPGYNNNKYWKNYKIRNWWDLMINFDTAFANGKRRLTEEPISLYDLGWKDIQSNNDIHGSENDNIIFFTSLESSKINNIYESIQNFETNKVYLRYINSNATDLSKWSDWYEMEGSKFPINYYMLMNNNTDSTNLAQSYTNTDTDKKYVRNIINEDENPIQYSDWRELISSKEFIITISNLIYTQNGDNNRLITTKKDGSRLFLDFLLIYEKYANKTMYKLN